MDFSTYEIHNNKCPKNKFYSKSDFYLFFALREKTGSVSYIQGKEEYWLFICVYFVCVVAVGRVPGGGGAWVEAAAAAGARAADGVPEQDQDDHRVPAPAWTTAARGARLSTTGTAWTEGGLGQQAVVWFWWWLLRWFSVTN